MVQRTKTENIERFEGTLEVLEMQEGEFEGQVTRQIHMAIEPTDQDTMAKLEGSKTGQLHNFLRLSQNVTEHAVPEGSNLDKYLVEIETVFPEAKDCDTFMEAFELMKGVNIAWVYKKIGKAYKGHEGKSFYVPQSVL